MAAAAWDISRTRWKDSWSLWGLSLYLDWPSGHRKSRGTGSGVSRRDAVDVQHEGLSLRDARDMAVAEAEKANQRLNETKLQQDYTMQAHARSFNGPPSCQKKSFPCLMEASSVVPSNSPCVSRRGHAQHELHGAGETCLFQLISFGLIEQQTLRHSPAIY